ncbi:MAG: hypothetical protein ACM3Q9_00980 [Methanosarcina sp.]
MKLVRPLLLSACFAAVVLGTSASAAAAAPFALDPTFGSGGLVRSHFGPRYEPTQFISLAPEAGGGVLAARHNGENGERTRTLRRYGPDGTLDPAFAPQQLYEGEAEATDAQGRTLRALGNALERLSPDGTRDPTFGVTGGDFHPFSESVPFKIERIVPLDSGKIVVAGGVEGFREGESYAKEIALARYDEVGHLDPGFGSAGVVKLGSDYGLAGRELLGVLVGPGERLLTLVDKVAQTWKGDAFDHSGSLIVALAGNGSLDSTFSGDGVIDSPDSVTAFEPLAGGGLLIAGDHWGKELAQGASESDLYVARLSADGSRDPAFGQGDGLVEFDLGGVDLAHALLVTSSGSLVLGGATTKTGTNCLRFEEAFCEETPALLRLLPDGTLDPAFAGGGALLGSLAAGYVRPSGVGVLAIAEAPDGAVFAAGGSGVDAFLAKQAPAGGLDPTFGSDGIVTERDPFPSGAAAHAIDVDRRGRVFVAGSTSAGSLPGTELSAVFRFDHNGALDHGFGGGSGFARVPGNAREIAADGSGGAYVLSGEYAPNLVTHVTARGILDPRFGKEGSASLPEPPPVIRKGREHWMLLDPKSILALPGGDVLIAGTAGEAAFQRIAVVRLSPRGRPRQSFGHSGIVVLTPQGTLRCSVQQIALAPSGRIVLAGSIRPARKPQQDQTLAVLELHPDGTLDHRFGRGGMVTARLSGRSYATSLAVGREGEIVVAGRHNSGNGAGITLLRLSAAGAVNHRFPRRAARSGPLPNKHHSIDPPEDVLLSGHRILLVGRGRSSVLAYSDRGDFQGTLTVGPEKPHSQVMSGALQHGRPILASRVSRRGYFTLRRYRPR